MKGPERPCSIKPQQTSLRNVLQRPVELAAISGRSPIFSLISVEAAGNQETVSLHHAIFDQRPFDPVFFGPSSDIARALNHRMGLDEIFVHLDSDARMFEGAYRSRTVDCERRAAKSISKEIFPRHVRLEISPVLD